MVLVIYNSEFYLLRERRLIGLDEIPLQLKADAGKFPPQLCSLHTQLSLNSWL